jgi:cob(I)alamin adenosyltransferase
MSESGFYTGRGDRGTTSRLGSTTRITKDSALIEAIGALDEATSAIGVARAHAQIQALKEALPTAQRHIYRLLSHLSATPETRETYPGLTSEEVVWLEGCIADLEQQLPPLKDFVLPGDSISSAVFHMARTIVRRAERRLVTFTGLEPNLGEANLAYINRLSSLMFVAALTEEIEGGIAPSLARG